MKRYYYHGIGDLNPRYMIDIFIEIIKSGGIKIRSYSRGYVGLDHICLYKKN